MLHIISFLQSFIWVDWLIILLLLYFCLDGWNRGFIGLFSSFVAYISTVWITVHFYNDLSTFIINKFGISSKKIRERNIRIEIFLVGEMGYRVFIG